MNHRTKEIRNTKTYIINSKKNINNKTTDLEILREEIRDLYFECKYKKVIEYALKYLSEKEDLYIRNMLAKSYRFLGLNEEAIFHFKRVLDIDPIDKYSLKGLFCLYYFLGNYGEAKKLIPSIAKLGYYNKESISIVELIVNKNLGLEYDKNTSDYTKRQIIEYDINKSINHVLNRHINDINEKSYFNSNININYLFECIGNDLDKDDRAGIEEVLDIYYYCVSGVGISEGKECSYIKVLVIPQTNNIINMYPTEMIKGTKYKILNCDYDILFNRIEEKSKTKTMSQIDKFNKKYNRV